MSRRSQPQGGDAAFVIIILIGAAAWTHRAQLYSFVRISLIVVGSLLLLHSFWKFMARRQRSTRVSDIDSMNGLDFEHYVAGLLRSNGFHNVRLTEQYDLGVDIIAEKDGICWGIQVKRYSGLVKADAVRQVVTGLKLYNCDRAMVITNSTYSAVAKRLAAGNDCVLIDWKNLKRLKSSSTRIGIFPSCT